MRYHAKRGPWCLYESKLWPMKILATSEIIYLVRKTSNQEFIFNTTCTWFHIELQKPDIFLLFECPSKQRGN